MENFPPYLILSAKSGKQFYISPILMQNKWIMFVRFYSIITARYRIINNRNIIFNNN